MINAHRCVLARYSAVFQEFFTNPMAQESVDGIVRIKDFSPGSVMVFLSSGFGSIRLNPTLSSLGQDPRPLLVLWLHRLGGPEAVQDRVVPAGGQVPHLNAEELRFQLPPERYQRGECSQDCCAGGQSRRVHSAQGEIHFHHVFL